MAQRHEKTDISPSPRGFHRALRGASCSLLLLTSLPGFAQASPTVDADSLERRASGGARLSPASLPYPPSVQQAVDEGRDDCLAQGGTSFVPRSGLVRIGDLTGAGRTDYAVDFREAQCIGRATVFSGTGGWDLVLFVTRRIGEPVRVFSGRVLDYDLEAGLRRRTVRFTLHGSYCGRVGADSCVKWRRLDARPFAFRN